MEKRDPGSRILVSPSLVAPMAADPISGYGGGGELPPLPESLLLVDPIPMIDTIDGSSQSWFPGLHHLPDLRSIESPLDLGSSVESSHKRLRVEPTVLELNTNMNLRATPAVMLRSDIARRRRKRISDRTRILAGLMPWERKMDTGTMLEEAHKYVKFLEAQVTALQTMPVLASGFVPGGAEIGPASGLEMLNRQQLLQVLVNSAQVQDILYKKGFCVFSGEQVHVLRQAVQRRPHVLLLLGAGQ